MAKSEVERPEGDKVYMQDDERQACPRCGRVVVDPKAK